MASVMPTTGGATPAVTRIRTKISDAHFSMKRTRREKRTCISLFGQSGMFMIAKFNQSQEKVAIMRFLFIAFGREILRLNACPSRD